MRLTLKRICEKDLETSKTIHDLSGFLDGFHLVFSMKEALN